MVRSLTLTAAEAAERRVDELEARARGWLPWPARPATLAGWRAAMGWTQSEAAGSLGVGLRTYQAWEGGFVPVRRWAVLACWALSKIREGVE